MRISRAIIEHSGDFITLLTAGTPRRRDLFHFAARLLCSISLVLCSSAATNDNFDLALPGYRYSFPHDYFNHPNFQTEWWYYTGNVQSSDGHRFGFELTFFRQGIPHEAPVKKSAWDVHDLYLAHLALSDITGGHFYHLERTNRAGPGIAGIDEPAQRIWNGNWQIQWKNSDQLLQAITEDFQLQFALHSEKSPVVHGENGVSQKAAGAGRASHYISLTRLVTTGTVALESRNYQISGLAWMDHEFFTHQLDADQVGWDWFSIQFDDHSELMLFHIRRKDGSIDPYSAGTYIDPQGRTTHLQNSDFTLQPIASGSDRTAGTQTSSGSAAANRTAPDTWRSPVSSAVYPIHWEISVPKLDLSVEATTPLPSQELSGPTNITPTYWEGATSLTGTRNSTKITGVGYLEMTGYSAKPAAL
jgi:predicted secreted hydrolase